MSTYIIVILLLVIASFFFNRYKKTEEEQAHDAIVRKYLVTNPTLAQSKKPFLWIHTNFESNARHWINFGSRRSTYMNQPYKFMTIKTIIDKCGDDFNVCLLNDESFSKIIPGWNIQMDHIGDLVKTQIREMGLIKILREYGGVIVPDSFVCAKSLLPLVQEKLVLRANTSPLFLSAPPRHELIQMYASKLECDVSEHSSEDRAFQTNWWEKQANVQIISDIEVGLKDVHNRAITLDRLMNNTFINISGSAYGVFIPAEEILLSTKYQWFARLSPEQLLTSKTMAGKYLLTHQQ